MQLQSTRQIFALGSSAALLMSAGAAAQQGADAKTGGRPLKPNQAKHHRRTPRLLRTQRRTARLRSSWASSRSRTPRTHK